MWLKHRINQVLDTIQQQHSLTLQLQDVNAGVENVYINSRFLYTEVWRNQGIIRKTPNPAEMEVIGTQEVSELINKDVY